VRKLTQRERNLLEIGLKALVAKNGERLKEALAAGDHNDVNHYRSALYEANNLLSSIEIAHEIELHPAPIKGAE
jgi:hypothetical protein